MTRYLIESLVLTTCGSGLVGYALFTLMTGGRVRPAIEAFLVGLGTVLIAIALPYSGQLVTAIGLGGGAIALSGSFLNVRRHQAEKLEAKKREQLPR